MADQSLAKSSSLFTIMFCCSGVNLRKASRCVKASSAIDFIFLPFQEFPMGLISTRLTGGLRGAIGVSTLQTQFRIQLWLKARMIRVGDYVTACDDLAVY